MLVLRFRKITEHLRGCAKKDEPAAFIEQHGLMEHLENFRTRLVNGDDDDLVVRHPTDDLHHMLRVLRDKPEVGPSKRYTFDMAIILKPMFKRLPLAAAYFFPFA